MRSPGCRFPQENTTTVIVRFSELFRTAVPSHPTGDAWRVSVVSGRTEGNTCVLNEPLTISCCDTY